MRPPAIHLRLVAIMTVLPVLLNVLAQQQSVLERPVKADPAPLPVPNPTRSFWIDSAPDANPLAKQGSTGPLTHDSDICIIGSGITGVSAAYHISRLLADNPSSSTPLKVVILEARDFCEIHPVLPRHPTTHRVHYFPRLWSYWYVPPLGRASSTFDV